MRPGISDELAGRLAFVTAQIVGNHDVAGGEGRHQALADPSREAVTVDRPVKDERGYDAVVAQSGEEGQGLPVAVRNMGREPLAPRSPAASAGHVGLDPSLIYKNQSLGIKSVLVRLPPDPEPRHLRAKPLAGHQRFF